MFFLNRGYRRSISEPIERVQGNVLLSCGNLSEKLLRMPDEYPRLLVDPQLYLAGLSADDSERACVRLATYPWFGVRDLPEFDSGETGLRNWEATIRGRIGRLWPGRAPTGGSIAASSMAAIEFQLRMRVAYVILPSPLITEREDEAQIQADWLDAGLAGSIALEVEQPLLATVALHEGALNDAAFEPAGFLDTIVDQVTARDEVDGVYIVIAQDGGASHPFETERRVLQAYLHFVRAFANRPYETVITNFADTFGLVCLGAGATAVVSGPSHSLRRLSLAGFREAGGGRTFPQFYSHPCVGEFLPETHLGAVIARNRGALRRIRDLTEFSEPLFEALERGAPFPAAWAEGQNNVAEAQRHFIARFASEAHAIARRRQATERSEHVREWLEDAIATTLFLRNRFGSASLVGRYAPVEMWLEMFDSAT